jgi:hypothetical protein
MKWNRLVLRFPDWDTGTIGPMKYLGHTVEQPILAALEAR